MEASVTITDSPDEVPMTENLTTIGALVEKQAWKRMLVTKEALSGQDKDPNG